MRKRLSALLMCILLLCVSPLAFAQESEDGVEQQPYKQEIEALQAIGLLDGAEAEQPATRALTAHVAAGLSGMSGLFDAAAGTGYFDVATDHPYAQDIVAARQAGLMTGLGSGSFGPDQTVTYAELSKILVTALGYDVYAGMRGGYPTGYVVMASSLKLNQGVGTPAGAAGLTQGQLACMVYNSLDVEVLQMLSMGAAVEYGTVAGDTLSKTKLDIVKGEGRVNANEMTALTGAPTHDGMVRIGSDLLDAGSTVAAQLLGYDVVYFASAPEGEDMRLLYIAPSGEQEVIRISYKDIVDVSLAEIEYRVDDEEQTASLSDDLVVLYNGEKIAYTPDDLRPDSGTVTLLDSRKNGVDVAFVDNYQYGIVKSVSTAQQKINLEYDVPSIELRGTEYKLLSGGKEITLLEIKAGDVVNVSRRSNGDMTIYVTAESVSGSVDELYDDGAKAVIGSTEYEVSEQYADREKELKLGATGKFYLNIMGEIVGMQLDGISSTLAYGYMMDSYLTETIDSVLKLKVFTTEETIITLTSADRLKFRDADGQVIQRAVAADVFARVDGTSQLIRYRTNADGMLVELHLAQDTSAVGNKVGTYGADAFTMDYTAAGLADGYFFLNLFDCKYLVSPQAPVFQVPTDKTDENGYGVITRDQIGKKLNHNVKLYNIDKNYEAGAVVIEAKANVGSYDWTTLKLAVIESSSFVVDADGSEAYCVKGLQDGEAFQLMCDDVSKQATSQISVRYKDITFGSLQPGDIIAYEADSRGFVKNFEVLFSYANRPDSYYALSDEAGMPLPTDYATALYLGYGEIKRSMPTGIVFNANGDGSDTQWDNYFVLENKLTRTMRYDSTKKQLTTMPFTDLQDGDTAVVQASGFGLWMVLVID